MVGLVIMALICVGVPFAGSAIAVFYVVGLVARSGSALRRAASYSAIGRLCKPFMELTTCRIL